MTAQSSLGKRMDDLYRRFHKSIPFYLMILPGVVMLFVFNYLPLYGLKIAFQRFIPAKGLFGAQEWVGLYWFQYMFKYPDFFNALRNTLIISVFKITLGILLAVSVSILISEVRNGALRRWVQTIVYLPHFLSWIILAGVFTRILSPSTGLVNQFIKALGARPIFFLGDNRYFRATLIVTDLWKEFGFNTIVYLAAITSIDPSLYESAVVDGANKFRQIWHITIPSILPIILLISVLNVGTILNANFDQIFNLYSPSVYETGDVLNTLVYRIGLVNANYSLSTAIGLFRSLVSMILIGASYFCAYKFADYQIF
jgi:putative aldouronate transport system permease protein